jgi:hypothetical protein
MADSIDLSTPENKDRFARLLTKAIFDIGLEKIRKDDPSFDPDKEKHGWAQVGGLGILAMKEAAEKAKDLYLQGYDSPDKKNLVKLEGSND